MTVELPGKFTPPLEKAVAMISRALCISLAFGLGSLSLAGCVVYEPVPAYYPGGSNFDRAWNAALGGAQDAGVQVASAEPGSGLIRGTKDGIEVVVTVARQADGSVRVQFDTKGPTQRDPGLADRFSRAYDRRMGR
jgi:hypothetical protein